MNADRTNEATPADDIIEHFTEVKVDRTVENMVAAVENVAEQIRCLIEANSDRGKPTTSGDITQLVDAIRATYTSLLPLE